MPFTFDEQVAAEDPTCVASFERTFAHTDWIDGESVVQAETEDGFNVRFQRIMKDLDALAQDARQGLDCTAALRTSLSKVLGEAQAELARLADSTATLTLAPCLVALSDPWAHTLGGAETPPNADTADGVMSVAVPDGATMSMFRVQGENPVGNLTVTLVRHGLAIPSTPDPVVTIVVDPTGSGSGGFVSQKSVSGPKALVDNNSYRYYVRAQVDGATEPTRLDCFQITSA